MPLAPRFASTRRPSRGAIARSRSRIGVELPTNSVPPSGRLRDVARDPWLEGVVDRVEEAVERRASPQVGVVPGVGSMRRGPDGARSAATPARRTGCAGDADPPARRAGRQSTHERVRVDGHAPRRETLGVGVEVPPVGDHEPLGAMRRTPGSRVWSARRRAGSRRRVGARRPTPRSPINACPAASAMPGRRCVRRGLGEHGPAERSARPRRRPTVGRCRPAGRPITTAPRAPETIDA